MSKPFAPRDLPSKLSACSSTQEKVRVTLSAFGGYWRPLAAVARLLEELGELGDALAAQQPDAGEVAGELADLWIITTALADQYLAAVQEPGLTGAEHGSSHIVNGVSGEPDGPANSGPSSAPADAPSHVVNGMSGERRDRGSGAAPPAFTDLVAAAGLVARIVNYYDGPKTPRSLDRRVSIADAVHGFHDSLAHVAAGRGIDLRAAVDAKLAAIPTLDSGRFSATWHDPATAPCLDAFRRLPDVARGPLATARLWGGPDWREGSIAEHAERIAPSLASFAKAAGPERLDAYVIPGPPSSSPDADRDWPSELLAQLTASDPQLARLTLRFDTYDITGDARTAPPGRGDETQAEECAPSAFAALSVA